MTVLGREGPAMRRQHPRIAEPLFRLGEDAVPQMVDEVEGDHRLQHRHMHLLTFSGALAMEQRHANGRGENIAADLVTHRHRHVTRRPAGTAIERSKAALTLDDIVERRTVAKHAILAKSGGRGIDDARIACRER